MILPRTIEKSPDTCILHFPFPADNGIFIYAQQKLQWSLAERKRQGEGAGAKVEAF